MYNNPVIGQARPQLQLPLAFDTSANCLLVPSILRINPEPSQLSPRSHGLAAHYPCSCHSAAHPGLRTLAISVISKMFRHAWTSGPLHLLFPLPRMPFCLKGHLLRGALSATLCPCPALLVFLALGHSLALYQVSICMCLPEVKHHRGNGFCLSAPCCVCLSL